MAVNPSSLAAVAATAEDADNFSITYQEARLKFVDTALTVPGAAVLSFRVGGQSRRTSKGAAGEQLYMDFAVVRGSHAQKVIAGEPVPAEAGVTKRLMVHACGLRGVDGFAGSAIQLALLKELAAPTSPETRGFSAQDLVDGDVIIFAHALNPYGFSWWRLNNGVGTGVDLSRNFHMEYGSTLQSGLRFQHARDTHNPGYTAVFDKEVESKCWGACTNRESLQKVRVELSEFGQFVDQAGMHYGGHELQQEASIALDALWDQGLRPDNHHLASVGFIQVTTDYGSAREELIITETVEMQHRVHALGVGSLAVQDESLLDDVTAGMAALIGSGKDEPVEEPRKLPVAERHTTVVAADTVLYPNTTLGSLLAAVRVQAPVDDDDKVGAIDQRAVDPEFQPPMKVAAGLTIAVPEGAQYPCASPPQAAPEAPASADAATSDSPQRRLAAGRWTRVEYSGEGCKVQLMAIQQFNTLSKSAVEAAKAAEHTAVGVNRGLELFADARMGLRNAFFVDKGHWRTELLVRGKRLFHAFAEQVFGESSGPGAESEAAVTADVHVELQQAQAVVPQPHPEQVEPVAQSEDAKPAPEGGGDEERAAEAEAEAEAEVEAIEPAEEGCEDAETDGEIDGAEEGPDTAVAEEAAAVQAEAVMASAE